jgi:hypothetical protein
MTNYLENGTFHDDAEYLNTQHTQTIIFLPAPGRENDELVVRESVLQFLDKLANIHKIQLHATLTKTDSNSFQLILDITTANSMEAQRIFNQLELHLHEKFKFEITSRRAII